MSFVLVVSCHLPLLPSMKILIEALCTLMLDFSTSGSNALNMKITSLELATSLSSFGKEPRESFQIQSKDLDLSRHLDNVPPIELLDINLTNKSSLSSPQFDP